MGRVFAILLAVQGLAVAALLASGFWVPQVSTRAGSAATVPVDGPRLRAFANGAELDRFLGLARQEMRAMLNDAAVAESASADAPALASVDASAPEAGGITNVQTEGVDEGGIVKMRGRHLIVLRRGRLFSIDTADGLRTISSVDAFPPGVGSEAAWYDEMLVSGDMVVVIGFNYGRQGTEINRFRIADDGRLTYRDTYSLRSNDYYSSENYASRLIGDDLIVYSPLMLRWDGPVAASLPALARYDSRSRRLGAFKAIAEPGDIFIPPVDLTGPAGVQVAHSVSRCDLAAETLDCSARVVLGSWSRSFYVSADAVYIWTEEAEDEPVQPGRRAIAARVYRLPFDRSEPGVVAVDGMPADQFSFREDGERLHVLVGAGDGDAMWDSASSGGPMRLLSLPLSRFASGNGVAEAALYRTLPAVQGYGLENRYVGGYLLYSVPAAPVFDDNGIGRVSPESVVVVPLDGGNVRTLATGHKISRIDIIGNDAIVIGENEGRGTRGLSFSTVALGATPAIIDRFGLAAAAEGESRSHAFFYRADAGERSGNNGVLGLPIRKTSTGRDDGGSAILYLRRTDRRLAESGQLVSRMPDEVDDNCLASCTDWYGNARPIFYGDRIFALMGYELVEGRMERGRIAEVRRIDFSPRRGRRQ